MLSIKEKKSYSKYCLYTDIISFLLTEKIIEYPAISKQTRANLQICLLFESWTPLLPI